jgi:hypothetical protein
MRDFVRVDGVHAKIGEHAADQRLSGCDTTCQSDFKQEFLAFTGQENTAEFRLKISRFQIREPR